MTCLGGARLLAERPVLPEEGLDQRAVEDGHEIDRNDAGDVGSERQLAGDGVTSVGQGVTAGDLETGSESKLRVPVVKRQLALAAWPLSSISAAPDPFDQTVLLTLAGLGLVEVGKIRLEDRERPKPTSEPARDWSE